MHDKIKTAFTGSEKIKKIFKSYPDDLSEKDKISRYIIETLNKEPDDHQFFRGLALALKDKKDDDFKETKTVDEIQKTLRM